MEMFFIVFFLLLLIIFGLLTTRCTVRLSQVQSNDAFYVWKLQSFLLLSLQAWNIIQLYKKLSVGRFCQCILSHAGVMYCLIFFSTFFALRLGICFYINSIKYSNRLFTEKFGGFLLVPNSCEFWSVGVAFLLILLTIHVDLT